MIQPPSTNPTAKAIKGRVEAEINLQAVKANFALAEKITRQNKTGSGQLMAVIKANAYGHGLVPIAEALSNQATLFAVTDINEALQLRNAGSEQNIILLQGIIDKDDIALIAQHNFQVVIHSLQQLAMLDEILPKLTLKNPLTFWLKAETGMGRLGIDKSDYIEAFKSLQSKNYTQSVILMTHLANSSLPDSLLNAQQIENFSAIESLLKEQTAQPFSTSVFASSGLLSDLGGKRCNSDWARPGIMLYGSSPFDFKNTALRSEKLGLQTVMTLRTRITATMALKAGDNVGYCSQFICPKDMIIGIASIGYADGYPSNAPNGTPILVNGQRTTTTGRVSMDMLALDLTHLPQTQVGDPVTLWGEDLSVDEVAEATGVIAYNLTSSVASRVNRSYG